MTETLLWIVGAMAFNAVIVGALAWAAQSARQAWDGCGNAGDE